MSSINVSQPIVGADVALDTRFASPKHELPNNSTLEAIRSLERLEGVLTDPIYAGTSIDGQFGSPAGFPHRSWSNSKEN
ncbi:1-aminocyclopropane-1-carboxylate deaminase [Burkholderia lata]|uniref:1-aminocyclopropane-1-carboxylate deaminase n=1 Tax=Burkholderia lata (strain ATCC 17760 / DSM 23089 / LMG 22485 / NCIMB 9086 / R18194 / 383) TaxID=482957 RepID=A0A6P2U908_BURL3|nr:hypothetical protein [Burkholderia lata]VWC65426.1 1-aminocyclopropane-1-carboxylate deaminase [Burkholderia lata]